MFCPTCGFQFSTADAFCRQCGRALASGSESGARLSIRNPYRGKNAQIFGLAVFILGILLMYLGSDGALWLAALGMVAFVTGVAAMIAGKFAHWYHAE